MRVYQFRHTGYGAIYSFRGDRLQNESAAPAAQRDAGATQAIDLLEPGRAIPYFYVS